MVDESEFCPRSMIAELCRHFYQQGWVSGTGGGISIKHEGVIYVAPSGVQKERMHADDMFTLDSSGKILEKPSKPFKLSACTPLFMHAYQIRDAGAVLHSHSHNAMLATLISADGEFRITQQEMIKGIAGHGFYDTLVVPIITNTAHEHELADSLKEAIEKYPKSYAVLVERHGVYVWGRDWAQAKTHAECYDYLFAAAFKMKQIGIDWTRAPKKRAISETGENGAMAKKHTTAS